jgi:tetratricopeptide (TPR) repeat protein
VKQARLVAGLSLMAFLLASVPRAAAADCQDWVARTVSLQGRVEARRAGEPQWVPVQLGATHCPGDAVRLGRLSRAAIVLRDGAVLRLDQNTTITFTPPPARAGTWIDLLTGTVHFFSRMPRGLRVTTPFVNGSVEGTEFLVEVEPVEARVSVWEGRVLAENAQGSLALTAGQSAAARAGQAPTLRAIVVRPADAVAWALYYPPVLDFRPGDFSDRPGEAWPEDVRRSLAAAQAGDLEAAFASLARVPDPAPDPRVSAYRASLLLSVGRVEEAAPAIERSLALDPGNAAALALRAILAVARNERAEAIRLAGDAVTRDPTSVAARVAQSYARQAAFDLDGARESVEAAVRLDPGSALARARLAELWLAQGRVDRALEEAEAAVRLGPALGRTHAVLGFVHLARLDASRASEAFERSIARDPAAPLPRLGLGLARIRRGDLEGGRQELEIAVSLDPGDSLLRSYLGKAYYEERRPDRAAGQLERAAALDPRDPTSHLYDAILQQSINRPVEALDAIQRSIELNDNRAVYRSRQFLDRDRGARSVSLGRIYDDLGFAQLALMEGWRSLAADPASDSAHRFLADAYSVLPRHEIARVSELLQSRLYQPLNLHPVQPEVALSQSFILRGAGPADPAFNEYNQLFEHNGISALASGLVGSNDTYADQVSLSALYGPFSISLGQLHYETQGFRPNNDLTRNAYDLFAQVALGASTSVLAELRYEDVEQGDLPLRFDPANFNPDIRQEERTRSARLGFHHAFAPGSELIGTAAYLDAEFPTKDVFPGFDLRTDLNGWLGEIQYALTRGRLRLVTGVGYFDASREDSSTDATVDPPLTTKTTEDIHHANLYLYTLVNRPDAVTWTLGVSADFLDSTAAGFSRDQVNPKVGVLWTPAPGTTVRAAFFRTLKRQLVSNQTIEPTQVAGFNQFFDDVDGTDAWRYGIGVDQKLGSRAAIGAEFSARELIFPFVDISDPESPRTERATWREQFARAYAYWAPLSWIAVTAEYFYEFFDRDSPFVGPELFAELRTHRVPLGVNLFHPMGITARLQVTYVDQEGRFENPVDGGRTRGHDQFWVADASISYRLPKRLGVLTLEGRNLLNERFRFQDTDPASPAVAPERYVLLRFTLAY